MIIILIKKNMYKNTNIYTTTTRFFYKKICMRKRVSKPQTVKEMLRKSPLSNELRLLKTPIFRRAF